MVVELEGIEPSSKQGRNMLSTRLFRTLVFVHGQDPDHPLMPYPLKASPCTPRRMPTISEFAVPPCQGVSEPEPLGDISSQHLVPGLSLNLLYFD